MQILLLDIFVPFMLILSFVVLNIVLQLSAWYYGFIYMSSCKLAYCPYINFFIIACLGTVSVLHLEFIVMAATVQTAVTISRMKLPGVRLLKLL